jgi:hypothetical protein
MFSNLWLNDALKRSLNPTLPQIENTDGKDSGLGRLAMHPRVGIAVDMGDGEALRIDAFHLDDRDLLEDQRAELGIRVERRVGFLMRVERRAHHLVLAVGDRVVSGAEFHDAASNRRPIEPVGDLSRAIWAHNSARLIPSILIAPIDGEARAMQDHADRASLGAPELSGGVAVPCSAASVPATA